MRDVIRQVPRTCGTCSTDHPCKGLGAIRPGFSRRSSSWHARSVDELRLVVDESYDDLKGLEPNCAVLVYLSWEGGRRATVEPPERNEWAGADAFFARPAQLFLTTFPRIPVQGESSKIPAFPNLLGDASAADLCVEFYDKIFLWPKTPFLGWPGAGHKATRMGERIGG